MGAAGSIFIITRYSVVMPAGARLSRNAGDRDDYRAQLLDADRLAARHQVFEAITAASLRAQEPCGADVHHLVCVSDILPPEHRAQLQRTLDEVAASSWIKPQLCEVDSACEDGAGQPFEPLFAAIETAIGAALRGRETAFATVRLDDDDALAPGFCAELCRFLKRDFAGMVATFPYGIQGVFDASTRTIVDVRRRYAPRIALGLSLLNFHDAEGSLADPRCHVYRLGNHMKVSRSNPLVTLEQRVSFLRTITGHNDTASSAQHEVLPAAFPDEVAVFRGLPFGPVTTEAEEFTLVDALAAVSKLRAKNAALKRSLRAAKAELAKSNSKSKGGVAADGDG